MKYNILNEQLQRMKVLMGQNIINEQAATTGCTQGDCENGTGTYVWENGDKYTGTWKDGQEIKGIKTYTDGSTDNVRWDNSGESNGRSIYTNKNGFKFPRLPIYRNADVEIFLLPEKTINFTNVIGELDEWPKKLQCAATGSKLKIDTDANHPVRLIRTVGNTTYILYKDGKYVKKEGDTKIDGTFSCSGNVVILKDKDGNETKLDVPVGSYQTKSEFPFKQGDYNQEYIKKVQKCLGFTGKWIDGKFGSETLKKLEAGGYGKEITKEVYDKIIANCGKKEEPKVDDVKKDEPTPNQTGVKKNPYLNRKPEAGTESD